MFQGPVVAGPGQKFTVEAVVGVEHSLQLRGKGQFRGVEFQLFAAQAAGQVHCGVLRRVRTDKYCIDLSFTSALRLIAGDLAKSC
ncbi:hypothetical protein D3C84_920740 [compost metagenome]